MFVFISFSLCSFLPSRLFEAGSLVPEDALALLLLLLALPERWNYSFPTTPRPIFSGILHPTMLFGTCKLFLSSKQRRQSVLTRALGRLRQKDCQFQASLNNNHVSFHRRKFRPLYQPTRPKEGLEQPAVVPCAISRLSGLIEDHCLIWEEVLSVSGLKSSQCEVPWDLVTNSDLKVTSLK